MNPTARTICSIALSCAVGIACITHGLSTAATVAACMSSGMIARLVIALLLDPEDLL